MSALPPLADHRLPVLRALDTLGARYTADGVTMGTIGDHARLDAGQVWLACSQLQYGGYIVATDTMPGAHPELGGDKRRTWSLTEQGRSTNLYEDANPVPGEIDRLRAELAAYRDSDVEQRTRILKLTGAVEANPPIGLDAGSWFYPEDDTSSDACHSSAGEVLESAADGMGEGETAVVVIQRALTLPDVYAALRVFTEAEMEQRQDGEEWDFTLHATADEAKAALGAGAAND